MQKNKEMFSIYADGGSRGNPGPSGVGVVLYDENGKVVSEISKYIGIGTNNVAEYLGVIYGLHEAIYRKIDKVNLNLDSQLVARQLKGEYKVKDQTLLKFCDIARDLFRSFEHITINEIPREANKEADKLVNKAIDSKALI